MDSNNSSDNKQNTSSNNESVTSQKSPTYTATGINASGRLVIHTSSKPVAVVAPRHQDSAQR